MKKVFTPILLGVLAVALPSLADDKWNISKLDASKLPPSASKTSITFEQDIKPMFEKSCVRCHGDNQQKGGFRVDSLVAVLKGGKAGKMIVPGDSTKSLLVLAVSQQDNGTAMPPKRKRPPGGPGGGPPDASSPPGGSGRGPGGPDGQGVPGGGPFGGTPGPGRGGPPAKALTTEQVALVRAWIDQGAK
ncbi:MAG TPA: c-type cytochrome domain-containing protein [Verrucomicrobiae bacterium]|jgi:hypothetical protein|nr:c-type cytochrome domain-containing protein [Verrucomicrobiae bacterium]